MTDIPQQTMFSRLRQRELMGGPVYQRPFIQEFSCEGECSGTIMCNASTARPAPVFGLRYGSHYNKFLAASDEEGYVSIINTAQALPSGLDDDVSPARPVAQWTAHRNAIFDLQWANSDRWMYTASGDLSLGLWDTSYAYKIASFSGHTGSVKTVSVSPHVPEIIASGSCDGNLLVWDARSRAVTSTESPQYPGLSSEPVAVRQPVLRLREPHSRPTTFSSSTTSTSTAATTTTTTYSRSKRRRNTSRSTTTPLQSRLPPSITAVNFLGSGTGHVIASGGVDGIVKFWDLRYTAQPTSTLPPLALAPPPSSIDGVNFSATAAQQSFITNARLLNITETALPQLGRRSYAVTSLALRPDSSQLLVSLTGAHHLLYDVNRPDMGPVKWFGGHSISSFYVKTAFSPDGSHFVSGSSDDRVCVWQVDGDADGGAPYSLHGHDSEVTSVAWCPTEFSQIASAGDDYTIKVWNVNRQRRQQEEKKDEPGGWIPLPRVNILMAAKPVEVLPPSPPLHPGDGGEDDGGEKENMVENRNLISGGETTTTPAANSAGRMVATGGPSTPTAAAAAVPPPPTRIRIANALKEGLMRKADKTKRTKQQTLVEALRAAHSHHHQNQEQQQQQQQQCDSGSAGGCGAKEGGPAAAKRPRSASENSKFKIISGGIL